MKARVYCVLSLVLLCLSGWFKPTAAAPGQDEQGVCPHKPGPGMCAEFCSYDEDCPGIEKCCSNGCGHECMAPYTAKPGVCPRRKMSGKRMCAELCSNDDDCPGRRKCCSNGCGHQCTAPIIATTKPGMCPRRAFGACVELCSNDADCPGKEKCCGNGCGQDCIAPLPGK